AEQRTYRARELISALSWPAYSRADPAARCRPDSAGPHWQSEYRLPDAIRRGARPSISRALRAQRTARPKIPPQNDPRATHPALLFAAIPEAGRARKAQSSPAPADRA